MALHVYNMTTSPITLVEGDNIIVPASDSAGDRGKPVNVTSEFTDLTQPQWEALLVQTETQVEGYDSLEWAWTGQPEYYLYTLPAEEIPVMGAGGAALRPGYKAGEQGSYILLGTGTVGNFSGSVEVHGGFGQGLNTAGGNITILGGNATGTGTGDGGQLQLQGGLSGAGMSGAGIEVLGGTATEGGKLVLRAGGTAGWPNTGRIEVQNGLTFAPPFSGRPAASAAVRGTMWLDLGDTGVADVLSICIKTAGDAYVWRTVTLV